LLILQLLKIYLELFSSPY